MLAPLVVSAPTQAVGTQALRIFSQFRLGNDEIAAVENGKAVATILRRL